MAKSKKASLKSKTLLSITALSLLGLGAINATPALSEILGAANIEAIEEGALTENGTENQTFCLDLLSEEEVQRGGDTGCVDCSCGDGSCTDGSCGCDGSC